MIEEDRQQAAEDAYTQARSGFELFGQELAPYSPSRKVAAQSMGMLYPHIGAEGAEQMERTGMYAGALRDMAIFFWLCTLPDADQNPSGKRWTPSSADRRPTEAKEQAIAWAESNGMLDTKGERFEEAWRLFVAIHSGIQASEFRLHVEGAGGEDPSPKV